MPRWLAITAVTILLCGSSAAAEEPKEEQALDFSRQKLLLIFNSGNEEQTADEPDVTFEYNTRSWNFRWLPLLTPIVPNVSFGHASVMPVPDPFALLGMEFPETAETYPDRGEQKRYRRRMVAAAHAANRAEKALRLRGGS